MQSCKDINEAIVEVVLRNDRKKLKDVKKVIAQRHDKLISEI